MVQDKESPLDKAGEARALASLPPPGTRWTARRKAAVLAAIENAVMTREEACDRYALSLEELAAWERLAGRVGVKGLRATRMQHYRLLEAGKDHFIERQ